MYCGLSLRQAIPFLTFVALGALPLDAAAQADARQLVGIWEGSLSLPATSLRLVFHIEVAEDGSLGGTWDSPDQGATGLPISAASLDGSTLTIQMANVGASFTGTVAGDGETVEGTFTQGGDLPLTLRRVEEAPSTPRRPQEPAPPFPYGVEEVSIENSEAGVTLAGTLTVPEGDGPFPGAVLVSGSGPQDRDEALMGHRPFLVLADHLTRQGIAVLRYDDRGVGESTGSFNEATTPDFASDALAALRHLAADPRVDPGGVGIVGHSEGGLVGPMVAAESDAVAWLVLLAGTGLPGLEILKLQGALINRAAGAPEEAIELNYKVLDRMAAILEEVDDPEEAEPLLRAAMDEAIAELPDSIRAQAAENTRALQAEVQRANSPWFRYFMSYDPRPTLERVRVPVLVLNGEKDLQVPPGQNVPEIEAALARGGNGDVTATVLPDLNHLFQTSATGAPAEYASIEETMSPVALEAVSSWILERFAGGR